MEPDITEQRQQAHALLDMLESEKVAAVRNLLQVMVEPLSQHLASLPLDDELSPETIAEIKEARASLERGEGIPHAEILREFGLKD